MAPLSLAYAEAKAATSQERGTYWATRAAEAGDPRGWYILGYEYTRGWLGGDPAFAYRAQVKTVLAVTHFFNVDIQSTTVTGANRSDSAFHMHCHESGK